MMLTDGYEYKGDVAKHPLGQIKRIAKQEYNILFERCILKGDVDEQLKSYLKALRYNSYIVSYDAFEDGAILLENIYPLNETMNSQEIKKVIVDILNAIKVLKDNYLSIRKISLSHIYRTNHHYKLDCFEIAQRDHKLLVQDLCYLFLSIIDEQEKELQKVLMMYSHLNYQKSINLMIDRVERIKINNTSYNIKNNDYEHRKIESFWPSFFYYIYDQYLIYVIVILVVILIFLM